MNVICSKPFVTAGGLRAPCGQCLPCRINARRIWSTRLRLEAMGCDYKGYVVTLTYSDDFYPPSGSLQPDEAQKFIKRLRYFFPEKIRYYFVGEYGRLTERAHYHALFFRQKEAIFNDESRQQFTDAVARAWTAGFFKVDVLSAKAISYVVKDVAKGIASGDEVSGVPRIRPFQRMSRNPPIGGSYIESLGEYFTSKEGSEKISQVMDVPNSVVLDGKSAPIGRTLRKRLRLEAGFASSVQPEFANAIQSVVREMNYPDAAVESADYKAKQKKSAHDAAFWDQFSYAKRSI